MPATSVMPAKKWLENDVSLAPIKDQTIAVIGYGIQGRAQASNMRDSGLNVIVGLRKGGKTWNQAESESHKVMEVAEAARSADIIHVLIPDMEQADTYTKEIAKHVTGGKALSFSHGAAIHWKWIAPPKNVDVIMVAPKGPGQRVRELYQRSEEHTSELQSRQYLVCRLLLEKKKKYTYIMYHDDCELSRSI